MSTEFDTQAVIIDVGKAVEEQLQAVGAGTTAEICIFGKPRSLSSVIRSRIDTSIATVIAGNYEHIVPLIADLITLWKIELQDDTPFELVHASKATLVQACQDIVKFLLDKNRKYGNSAIEPVRIFSKADAVEQIKVRIDDKLSRLMSKQGDEDEDVLKDLIGYLFLLKVALCRQAELHAFAQMSHGLI